MGKQRDRARTECRMLDVSEAILERDGVLAGVNLAEVAEAVGVNRSLIYQYFGSRQELLRRALQRRLDAATTSHYPSDQPHRHPLLDVEDPPYRRAINDPLHIRLLALMHLDGEREVKSLPRLPQSLELLEHVQSDGELPPDLDLLALHISLVSLYYGYGLFREKFAEEAGVAIEKLDKRMVDFYGRIVMAIKHSAAAPAKPATARAGGTRKPATPTKAVSKSKPRQATAKRPSTGAKPGRAAG